jgi:hypothetical protein
MAHSMDEKDRDTMVPAEKDVESLETTSVRKGDILSFVNPSEFFDTSQAMRLLIETTSFYLWRVGEKASGK